MSGFRNASINALAHAAPQLQSLALIKCPWLTNSCVQHFNGSIEYDDAASGRQA